MEARGGDEVQIVHDTWCIETKDLSNHLVSGCARTADRDLESGTSDEKWRLGCGHRDLESGLMNTVSQHVLVERKVVTPTLC